MFRVQQAHQPPFTQLLREWMHFAINIIITWSFHIVTSPPSTMSLWNAIKRELSFGALQRLNTFPACVAGHSLGSFHFYKTIPPPLALPLRTLQWTGQYCLQTKTGDSSTCIFHAVAISGSKINSTQIHPDNVQALPADWKGTNKWISVLNRA